MRLVPRIVVLAAVVVVPVGGAITISMLPDPAADRPAAPAHIRIGEGSTGPVPPPSGRDGDG
ncbi:hypothetical protein H7X46_22635 [Pseudonocardia sp. C8]|uniref:hypothetical protein n=1 Tax=Pseudonocardia sp. C8 TaxID=2762759 RepID=UPI001642DE75|nr:hypothetical protein [Pseudonocardia sp. C8]MBC3193862.1 hypothetical protein [Pseudonocardia sp. C8]